MIEAGILMYIVVGLALAISLYLWGIIRTAIWTLPCLFIADFLALSSIALLSFWSICVLIVPHRQGAYDWRALSREKQALCFFLSGVLTGTFLYPTTLFIFAFGALIPLSFLLLFEVFRFPSSRILFLPKALRLGIPAIWIICFAAVKLGDVIL